MRTTLWILIATLAAGAPAIALGADAQETGVERAKLDDVNVAAVVPFAFGSSQLGPRARAALDGIAAQFAGDARRVEVAGHTDATGPEPYNTALSDRRAHAVAEYLAAHGVAADRLTTLGYGANQPVDTNGTGQGRARNRRVDLRTPN
jgi:outer membrane protein OmpA-like peptidoglycan-associated protein